MIDSYRFDAPWLLLALLLIPLMMYWRHRRGRAPVWLVPHAAAWMPHAHYDWRGRIAWVYVAMALLTLAAARPQRVDERVEVSSRGYDLALAVDLSTSMLAEDYANADGPVNRLEAIRPIIQAFMSKRANDRIGIVAFAGRAYTLSPLTMDHDWLAKQVRDVQIGFVEDGTAVGEGLGMSLMQLEKPADLADEPRVGAFVILLTDGANTSGTLTPPQATAIAAHRGIPVYTIGAGRNGMVPFPVFDHGKRVGTRQRPSDIDEEALRRIASQTGGKYFSAGDSGAVEAAFAAIDAAQKTQTQTRAYRRTTELFLWFALPALACLLMALPSLLSPLHARAAR
jgi:Ca-activated chloride channel family protein